MGKKNEEEPKYKLDGDPLAAYLKNNEYRLRRKYLKRVKREGLKLTKEQKRAGLLRVLDPVREGIDGARGRGRSDVSDFYLDVYANTGIYNSVKAQSGIVDPSGENILTESVIPEEGQTAFYFLSPDERESITIFARERSQSKGLSLDPPGVEQVIREGLGRLDKQVEKARKAKKPMQLGTFYITAARVVDERINKLSKKKQ